MENQHKEKLFTQDKVLVSLTLLVFLATTYTSIRAYIFLLDVESTWTAKEATNLILLLMLWLAGIILTSILTAVCKLRHHGNQIKTTFSIILVVNWISIGLMAFIDLSRPPPDLTISGAIFDILFPFVFFAPLVYLTYQVANSFRIS